MTPRTTLAILLLLAPICGAAQVVQKGNSFTFRLDLAKGRIFRYGVESNVASANTGTHTTLPLVMQVTEVDKGIYTFKVTQGPMTQNGKVQGEAATRYAKIKADGTVVGKDASPFPVPSIPNRPLKVGDSWEAPAPLGQVAGNVPAKYKFRGIKTLGGKRFAEVGIAVDATAQGMTLLGNGDMFVSTADGVLSRITMTMVANVKGNAKVQPVHLVTAVTRK